MMSNYRKKPTQERRILNLLRRRGAVGVAVYEFMIPINQGGLGIAQYNARIYGLRQKGHIIKSKKPGHFVLVRDADVSEEPTYFPDKSVELDNGQRVFV